MKKQTFAMTYLTLSLLLFSTLANAAGTVPEPFRGHDETSSFTLQYGDVDMILKTMVVDVGRSTREKAAETHAKTGTRMKLQVKRETANEANRFYFEEFRNNVQYQTLLHEVALSLEAIPGRMALEHFSRDEQLAYWLNLYNITVLDELVQIYPERNLKKEIVGNKSIFEQKILKVAGIDLSLNDIQHTILATNYDKNPLILYGLYKGNIGGPNIRKRAFTGENVYRMLQYNAEEFVNSNRGTYAENGQFEVSTLYERNKQYFPNFQADLKQHLLRYIEGQERTALQAADFLKPDIDDWTIADVYGTHRTIGGSFTDSNAAMIDAVVAISPSGTGGTSVSNFSGASSALMAKAAPLGEFDPQTLAYLTAIKQKEEAANLMKEGRVTVEEMGQAPEYQRQQQPPENEEDEN